ncbi:MAG: dihydroorotate dehydrogenase [Bacteroidales bacterium]|nr:dihydroorotate dehydrogenase [Bacteroidales bacterium]MDE6307850.1 dihydroorotate dehydrogenase [Bacteroidales bacterium]
MTTLNLQTDIGRLTLKNPVMTASGTFGYGLEYADFCHLNALGGMVLKGTTLHPREGNPYPRMAETPAGMLNAVGLQNKGVKTLIKDLLPPLQAHLSEAEAADKTGMPTRILVNLSGSTVEDYVEAAELLDAAEAVSGVELNISCPNVKQGGMAFGTRPDTAAEVVSAVRKAYRGPLLVKLSPNVTDIAEMARAVEGAGADGVALINTLLGMEVDIEKAKPVLSTVTGGLSGPCVRPVALRMVWQVAKAVKIPVVGMGGIVDARDAIAFLMVGASAVEVGTANFEDPASAEKIAAGIAAYMERKGIADVRSLIGVI